MLSERLQVVTNTRFFILHVGTNRGDFDNDGDIDIISYFGSGSFSPRETLYFENSGDITMSEGVQFGMELSASVQDPVALDYDSDGDMDIIYLDRRNVNLYTNDEAAIFEHSLLVEGRGLGNIGIVDLDDDSDWDIIAHEDITFNEVYLLTFTNDGNSNFAIDTIDTLGPNSSTYQLEAIDIDEDGDKEIVRAALDNTRGVLSYYDNDGNGGYEYQEILSINYKIAFNLNS